jgi:hypothetical protein
LVTKETYLPLWAKIQPLISNTQVEQGTTMAGQAMKCLGNAVNTYQKYQSIRNPNCLRIGDNAK